MNIAGVATTVQEWLASGRQVAVAWPVAYAGFSSRRPGEVLAVTDTGQQVGEVLGDRVTASLADVLAGRFGAGGPRPVLLTLPVDESAAAAAGLACGGTVTVALHHAAAVPPGFWQAVVGGQAVALVTYVGDDHAAAPPVGPGSMLVDAHVVAGSLGTSDLDEEAADAARGLLAGGRTASRVVASTAAGGSLVVEAVVPVATLVVVGGGDLADAIGRQATLLGWQPSVVDGPDPASPAAALARLGRPDGVVVLSHDHDVGVPALAAALATDVGYIGALGSRRTQAARRDALLARGTDERDLARIHGPAGLDLGGRAPEEIALAICAEMLAARYGRDAGGLSKRGGPIHN